MRHCLGYFIFGAIGGPVALILCGYVVAFWSTVASILIALVALFIVAAVIEGVKQQRDYRARMPRFDADAEARAAFRVRQTGDITPR